MRGKGRAVEASMVLAQPDLQEIPMMVTAMRFRALVRIALDGPLTAMRRRIVRNATERTLTYMDDHLLRDVGLTRFDINYAIRLSSFWRWFGWL